MPGIYYAHSKLIYNTPREQAEAEVIAKTFPGIKVCNPNTDMGELGSMAPYLAAVQASEIVIVSEYQGHVGRGACEEVRQAFKCGLPVWVLRQAPKGRWTFTRVTGVGVTNPDDWKVTYAILTTEKLHALNSQSEDIKS